MAVAPASDSGKQSSRQSYVPRSLALL
jgi:hypothetical protein